MYYRKECANVCSRSANHELPTIFRLQVFVALVESSTCGTERVGDVGPFMPSGAVRSPDARSTCVQVYSSFEAMMGLIRLINDEKKRVAAIASSITASANFPK